MDLTARATTADRLRRALGAGGGTSDFDLNGDDAPAGAVFRPAGVLVLVTPDDRVILTKRSSHLRHHPGQIAFAGGKVDPGDGDAVGAALREAGEEIGLPRSAVEVLGTLPAHRTGTGFAMTPVLAMQTSAFTWRAEAGEVDEIFAVPLAHLLDPARYRIEAREWNGRLRRYYVVPWGPYYIWGATARILRALAERMA